MRAQPVVAALLVLIGCTSDQTPTGLVANLSSRISMNRAREILKVRGDAWRVIEDNKPSNAPKDAPYHFVVVAVSNFFDLDETGEARLQFFNDRLIGVWFYPSNLERYKAKLQKERGVALSMNGEAQTKSHTRIRLTKDYSGRTYVAYEDIILEREHDSWVAKHS